MGACVHAWVRACGCVRGSFQAAKLVRSQRVTDTEVYALFRIAKNLEQPAKSKVVALLTGALRFRNCSVPAKQPRLRVPFLAHADFKTCLTKWLRQQIQQYKHWLIPLHLPSKFVDEGSHLSLAKALHNIKQWESRMTNLQPSSLPCCCQELTRQHPHLHFVDGHVASSASLLSLDVDLHILVSFSSSSTFYPTFQSYRGLYQAKVDAWFKAQGFPLQVAHDFWTEFFPRQWYLHEHAIAKLDFALQEPQVTRLKRCISNKLVVHLADHQASHLMVFCPQFYFQSVLRVWQDVTNFKQIKSEPHLCRLQVRDAIPGDIRKRYAWGVRQSASLPQGIVFLKEKKDFRKGRSVIAYNRTITERLQRAAASAIEQMIHACFPEHFGSLTLPQIFDKLHSWFRELPVSSTIGCQNDDLVGFFNSVPQVRILQTIDVLMLRYSQLTDTAKITVCIAKGKREVKSISGRTTFAGDPRYWKSVDVSDVPAMVQASFDCGIFQACGALWQQHDGTCIGNQISPILSSLPVLCTEVGWQALFASSRLLRPFIAIRYVDNRLILFCETLRQTSSLKALLHPMFYGAPIELEDVGSQEFLGFEVDHHQREIRVKPLHAFWQVRHPGSAGSPRLLISGLRSRLASVSKYAWPPEIREHQSHQILHFHAQAGYDPSLLATLKACWFCRHSQCSACCHTSSVVQFSCAHVCEYVRVLFVGGISCSMSHHPMLACRVLGAYWYKPYKSLGPQKRQPLSFGVYMGRGFSAEHG